MKKIAFTLAIILFSSFNVLAQKNGDNQLYVKVKDDKKPLIYVDGKKFDFSMDLIDQSQINSVHVLKGDEALALYNSPNGVILITTKVSDKLNYFSDENKLEANLKMKPMIIIDGKVSDKKILDKLKTENIKKMEVLKGDKAIKSYNAPNGVIIITTKNN